jgi:hypothetical protein
MLRRKRKLDDFNSEIEAHIQLETERLREQGLSEGDARAVARRPFGNVMHAEERATGPHLARYDKTTTRCSNSPAPGRLRACPAVLTEVSPPANGHHR